MAEIVRYVNTASSAGGDGTTNNTSGADRAYASLNEWEAIEQTNLVAAGNTYLVHCEGSDADTVVVSIDGWTTGVSNYITIQVDSDKRHSGEWSTSHYRLSVANVARVFTIREDYVNIEGLQIELSAVTAERYVVQWANINASNSINFTKCIIRGADNDSYPCKVIKGEDADAIVKFRNCLIYNAGHADNSYGFNSAGTHILENVTVTNCWICIRGTGTWTETNVLCDGVDTGNAFYTWYNDASHTRTYCASNDDKADDQGGAGNRVNQTFAFINAAADNYHLKVTDVGAKDYGTDLSGQGYTDDIDDEERTGDWDIGCDEAIESEGSSSGVATALANTVKVVGAEASGVGIAVMAGISGTYSGVLAASIGASVVLGVGFRVAAFETISFMSQMTLVVSEDSIMTTEITGESRIITLIDEESLI